MTRDEIVDVLTELGRRLAARQTCGEMYVVGGAAVALAFDERRTTRDVDAVFEPKATIYTIAQELGDERDLGDGWLNDAVKGFLAGTDDGASIVLEVPGLRVSTASPRVLLAMKVLAHRVGEDDADVRLLADALGLRTADDVLDVAHEMYGDRLDVAARFFVEQALDA